MTYCIKYSLEEWADVLGAPSCLVDFIPESINPTRQHVLEAKFEGLDAGDGPAFDFLDAEERAAIALRIIRQ